MKLHLVKIKQKSILSILIIGILFTITSKAATFTVNQIGDAGDGTCDATCTLRDAILEANAVSTDDTIEFASPLFDTQQTITLGGTELTVANNGSLNINGKGQDLITISGNNASRVFYNASGSNVTLNQMTISNGNGGGAINNGEGGCIHSVITTLIINEVRVTGCSGSQGGGLNIIFGGSVTINNSTIDNNFSPVGGGMNTQVLSNINNSTFHNNRATAGGAGIFNSGGSVNLTNSTISGNFGASGGGGIEVSSGFLNSLNSTIVNNSATFEGGGLKGFSMNLRNTIVANNTAPFSGPDINGFVTSQGYNLIENTSGATINGDTTGNIMGQDPQLSTLNNYGGLTQTHSLLPGSPAIDAADPNNFPPTDQRGNLRPADGNPNPLNNSVALALLPDMGAFEALAPTSADALISGKVLSAKGRGMPNAIVHLTEQDGSIKTVRTNQFGYFKFKSIEVGQTLILNVYSRLYQYDTQIVNFDDSLTDLNFTPQTVRKRSPKTEKKE